MSNMYQKYLDEVVSRTLKEILPILKSMEEEELNPKSPITKIKMATLKKNLKILQERITTFQGEDLSYNDLIEAIYPYHNLEIKELRELWSLCPIKLYQEKIYEKVKNKEILKMPEINFLEDDILKGNYTHIDDVFAYFMYLIKTRSEEQQKSKNIITYPMVSYETFEMITAKWVENKTQKLFQGAKCFVLPQSKLDQNNKDITNGKHVEAYAEGSDIYVAIELLQDIYNGKYYNLIKLFHEIRHIEQHFAMQAGIVKKEVMDMILDTILTDILIKKDIKVYYEINYKVLSFELDAIIHSIEEYLEYYKSIGSPVKEEDFYQNKIEEKKKLYTDKRVIAGHEYNLYELFFEVIKDKPEYLEDVSQLKMILKTENGILVPKTSKEIKEEYALLGEDEKEEYEELFGKHNLTGDRRK